MCLLIWLVLSNNNQNMQNGIPLNLVGGWECVEEEPIKCLCGSGERTDRGILIRWDCWALVEVLTISVRDTAGCQFKRLRGCGYSSIIWSTNVTNFNSISFHFNWNSMGLLGLIQIFMCFQSWNNSLPLINILSLVNKSHKCVKVIIISYSKSLK